MLFFVPFVYYFPHYSHAFFAVVFVLVAGGGHGGAGGSVRRVGVVVAKAEACEREGDRRG